MAAPPAGGAGMEISGLARNPTQEIAYRWVLAQPRGRFAAPLEFGIAEIRVYGAVTDRMERHSLAPAPASWHGMVPFDAPPQRTRAEPAGLVGHCDATIALHCDLAGSKTQFRIRKLSNFQPYYSINNGWRRVPRRQALCR